MSVKQLDAVFDKSKSEGAAFQVAIALADWADDAGWCHPSYSQIQRKAHIRSRATVMAALDTLQALGELKVIHRGWKPTTADDDDVAGPIARQHRNLYRLLVRKPKAGEVVQHLNHLKEGEVDQPTNHPPSAEVVQPLNHLREEVDQSLTRGGSATDPRGSSILDAHIRNEPSVLSVSDPSAATCAAAAAAMPADAADEPEDPEALRVAWNAAIPRESKLIPVDELTADRRARLAVALKNRTLEEWAFIFARVAESSFLQGYGTQGFVATLWWVTGKPEASLGILEGKYDDHFTDAELSTASHSLFHAYGPHRCPHQPTCTGRDDRDARARCIRRHALTLRWQKRATA